MRRRTTPTLSASLHFIALTKPPPTGSVPLCESKVTVGGDRKSTRLNSSHSQISYAVFCLKKKTKHPASENQRASPIFSALLRSAVIGWYRNCIRESHCDS